MNGINGSMLSAGQLTNVLTQFGADKDPEGRFFIRGGICSFLDAGQEFLINDTAEYQRDGKWYNLLQAVKVTSYYVPVQVLM